MALAEIADFIVNVFQLLHYLLKISIFIGKILVEIIANGSFIVWKILQAIGRFMVVFYEDYAFFIEDFKSGLSSIALFFIECLSTIFGSIVKGVLSIGDAVVAGYHGIGELLSGRLLTVPIFTLEFVKQLLVLIGNGVWFLVTLPGHFAKNFWVYSNLTLAVIEQISRDAGSRSLVIAQRLGNFLVKDVPLQSAAGIFILILAYMNPKCTKRIARFCYRFLRFIYQKLLPYGRGIRRKYLQCRQKLAQFITSIFVAVLSCFLYLQNRAVDIYDAGVHQTFTFMRTFFTFSDRRRPFTQRAHRISRIENRNDQSSSESRSSSTSSNQSTESRPHQSFAQISPGKKPLEGAPAIGLCIICEDNEKSVVLVPCGHLCLCKECADQLGNYDRYCPICRTLIYRKVNVFI